MPEFPRWFVLVSLGVFGLVFGSFANVVIWRLPRGENLSAPPSACPSCGHPIRWYDNVPVASWLVLRARCRDCAAPISGRYPLVEALSGALFVSAGIAFDEPGRVLAAVVFFWTLLVLSFIDLDTMRLPNPIVGALAIAGAVFAAAAWLTGAPIAPLTLAEGGVFSSPVPASLLGAVLGAGLSLGIAAIYAGVRKQEGFGMGDVKLLGAMGLFLGPYVLVAFFLGSLLGTVGRIAGAAAGAGSLAGRAPFGPYLAIAGVLTALFGHGLVGWYFGLVGLV